MNIIYNFIKNIRNNYEEQKYVKLNTKNIFNYLTSSDILYINNKINPYLIYIIFNLYTIIKLNNNNWLIKNKNILLIKYKHYLFSININNLDDIIIYNSYFCFTKFLLNKVERNKSQIIYSSDNNIQFKNTGSNYKVVKKINRFNTQYFIYYENINFNFRIKKILDNFNSCGNIFYYYKYNIYIKFSQINLKWFLNYRQKLAIRKIKLLLI